METRQYDPWELEDLTTEDLSDIGLDKSELGRLQEVAEHPELENYDVARAGRWSREPRDRDGPNEEESERRFGEWLDDMERRHGMEPAGWREPDSDEEAPE